MEMAPTIILKICGTRSTQTPQQVRQISRKAPALTLTLGLDPERDLPLLPLDLDEDVERPRVLAAPSLYFNMSINMRQRTKARLTWHYIAFLQRRTGSYCCTHQHSAKF